MKDIAYICEKIKILFNIDFTCIDNSYRYLPLKQMSPYCTETLKNILIQGADRQDGPYIYKDEYDVCFVCLRCEDRHYMLGPMSMRALSLVEYRKFYHTYEITENNEKYLKRYTPEEILSITELTAILLLDKKYTDEELLGNNPFLIGGSVKKTDEEDLLGFHEEESYHHTYEEERRLLDYIQTGQVQEAVSCSKKMDAELGRLSKKELNHWKYAAVAAVTLGTRAAIHGGVAPTVAYRLSDFYIQKFDQCTEIAQVVWYRNMAVKDLTENVQKKQLSRSMSSYVERCKDYVENHYRSKIYVKDIARSMGISPVYLSRLFHEKTGMRLQDYISRVRVEHGANLLMYSEESIARIAEYVNFPSQSYFGKVFKKYKHMSPRQFRENYKPSGF